MSSQDQQMLCRFIRVHLPSLYTDIHAPFSYFKYYKWNVSRVLRHSKDSLFYNEEYMTEEDIKRFNELYENYKEIIKEIFVPSGYFMKLLTSWTCKQEVVNEDGTTSEEWVAVERKSRLRDILQCSRYDYFSPIYVIDLYVKYTKIYQDHTTVIDCVVEKLEAKTEVVKKHLRKFRRQVTSLVTEFVATYPVSIEPSESAICAINSVVHEETSANPIEFNRANVLMNAIMKLILEFAELMIPLHVHAIHELVNSVVAKYVHFDGYNVDDDCEVVVL